MQSLKDGRVEVVDTPCPRNLNNHVLVETHKSLMSSGTERSLIEFGKAGYIGKARQRPDKVQQTIEKLKTDGIVSTIEAISTKLDELIPLGYCNVGYVRESQFSGIRAGERVVSNGNHAEIVRVPGNLCAKVPNGVTDEQAAFTVVAAIALQAVRLVSPSLGENIGVIGAGLIGQLCIQLLLANGCRVLATDTNRYRCDLAESFGAMTVQSVGKNALSDAADLFTNGNGMDGMILAASTASNEVIHDAARISRKRGRIILLGSVGLQLRRDDFYKKELTFQVSSSYGPGRYDTMYEEKGQDYPLPFVRWTAQRNFNTVLDLMALGRLNVKPLISGCFKLDGAEKAYSKLEDPRTLGVLFDYLETDQEEKLKRTVSLSDPLPLDNEQQQKPVVGVIGAGKYATRVLFPALRASGVVLDTLITGDGLSGIRQGEKNGFRQISTDLSCLWSSQKINSIVIGSRHGRHANEVIKSLESGKHVFVEKPLAITLSEIDEIEQTLLSYPIGVKRPILMVDFNRRFAPLVVEMKKLLASRVRPKSIIYTVNAGFLSQDHWAHDPKEGGGRIIGEVCHFIDLVRYLVGSEIQSSGVISARIPETGKAIMDEVSVSLVFSDGSMGTIHYLANGSRQFPKERLEVFCAGGILQLDNFRSLKGLGWPGFQKRRLWRQDKGNRQSVEVFIRAVGNGLEPPIPIEEFFETSRETVKISQLLQSI